MKYYLSKTQHFVLAFFLLTFVSVKAQTIIKTAGTIVGSAGDGAAAINAQLNNPYDVALDGAGNIYIADLSNHRIRKVTVATGIISTVAGTGAPGFSGDGAAATSAQLNAPFGVTLDAAGNIYIADAANRRIRKVTIATGFISTIAGNGVQGTGGDGAAATSAQLLSPYGVAVDAANNVYIADPFSNKIRKITITTGIISTIVGTGVAGLSGDGGAATLATLNQPSRIALDAASNVYITDRSNHRIRKLTVATGIITTIAGTTQGFGGDGAAATNALLNIPYGVAVDANGDVLIADTFNYRIRKLTVSTGIISTIAGGNFVGNTGDCGAPINARFGSPIGIVVDGVGNIHIADNDAHRTRKIINSAPITPSVVSQNNVSCNGGSNGSATISASGGVGALSYSWSPSGGTAPTATGLSAGIYVCTITDGLLCSRTQSVTIVAPAPTTFLPAAGILPAAVIGVAYTQNITQTGLSGTVTFSVSPALSAGLSLNTATGIISGTPTASALATNYTITATSGACSSQVIYSLTVSCTTVIFSPAAGTLPVATIGVAYTQNITQTGITGTVTFSISPALPAGLSFNTSNGTISGTPTAVTVATNYTITATNGTCSSQVVYSLSTACAVVLFSGSANNAAVGVPYSFSVGATITPATATAVYSISPALPGGLSLNTATGIISGTPIAAMASTTYVVTVSTGCLSSRNVTFAIITCTTATFTPLVSALPAASVGVVYSQAISQTGITGTVTFSVSPALPTGLGINTSNGTISGTPTAAIATTNYTVTATNGTCSGTAVYSLTVSPCATITFGSATATNGAVGVAYSLNAGATASPTATITYSVLPALPAGILLNTATGAISGTPTAVTASATYAVRASTNVTCNITKTYTFEVTQNPTTAIDNGLSTLVKVSPNPSNGMFNVDFGGINVAKSFVRVYDAKGKVIFTSENNNDLMSISLDKFANGIYLLEVETSKGRILKRLAKQ